MLIRPSRCGAAVRTPGLLALALALAGCDAVPPQDAPALPASTPPTSSLLAATTAAPLRYTCPMHPQIVRDEPGTCPICGMSLVARQPGADTGSGTAAPIVVEAGLRQALGFRSAPVETRVLAASLRAPAQVIVDEHRIEHLHSRVAGWVETLKVHAIGDPVAAEQVVLELYAPDLVAAQEDYLIALRSGGAGSRAQAAAAVRLRQRGVGDEFIDALAKRGSSLMRVPVRAGKAGVVTQLNVRHGMYVEPSTVMVEISDFSQVWVRVDVFPEQLDRLDQGKIYGAFTLPGVPDRVWRAEASYVYPAIDELTQTIHLRFPVPNRAGVLKIGSFMDARLRGEDPPAALAIPSEALIRTAHGERVIVDEGEGRFRPVIVHAGHRAEGWTSILHGLREGQKVVVSAQFLLDSESALRAGLDRLEAGHAH